MKLILLSDYDAGTCSSLTIFDANPVIKNLTFNEILDKPTNVKLMALLISKLLVFNSNYDVISVDDGYAEKYDINKETDYDDFVNDLELYHDSGYEAELKAIFLNDFQNKCLVILNKMITEYEKYL